MSDWKRTTKEVPIEGLQPEMVTAIQRHLEQYNLGSVLSDATMCVQTDSEKVKKGLFGSCNSSGAGFQEVINFLKPAR